MPDNDDVPPVEEGKPSTEDRLEEKKPLPIMQAYTYLLFEGDLHNKDTVEHVRFYAEIAGDLVNVKLDNLVFVVKPGDDVKEMKDSFILARRVEVNRRMEVDRRQTEDRRIHGDRNQPDRRHEDRRHKDLGHVPDPYDTEPDSK